MESVVHMYILYTVYSFNSIGGHYNLNCGFPKPRSKTDAVEQLIKDTHFGVWRKGMYRVCLNSCTKDQIAEQHSSRASRDYY